MACAEDAATCAKRATTIAAAPVAGKCVHCLRGPVPRTWDHVFPRSWYPDSTAPNVEKWKIPACERCNKRYGKLEEELLTLLGLCVDPNLAATAGITDRVLRSFDPSEARNARDAKRREAKRRRIRARMMTGASLPSSGHYLGLSLRTTGPGASDGFFYIPVDYFRGLTQKIVRGIFYLDSGRFIEERYVIEHYALDDEGAAPVVRVLDQFGQEFAHEPGILVRRAMAQGEEVASFFSIEIWRSFKMFASVDDPTRPDADPNVASLIFGKAV